MRAFVGKWKQDDLYPENFKDFIKVAGIPDDVAEKSFKMPSIWEIQQDGKKLTINVKKTTEPILTKSYEYTVGEPYDSTDIFGRKFKLLTEIVSDTKVKQTCTEWSESAVDLVREIKGDKMINTATCKGVSMTTTLTRV